MGPMWWSSREDDECGGGGDGGGREATCQGTPSFTRQSAAY